MDRTIKTKYAEDVVLVRGGHGTILLELNVGIQTEREASEPGTGLVILDNEAAVKLAHALLALVVEERDDYLS